MRVNLVADPSLRSGTVGAYVARGGATLSYTADYAFYGSGALVVTKTAQNGAGVRLATPVPVVVGLPYAFSTYTRLPVEIPASEPAEVILQVEWMNSVGSVIATHTSATLVVDDDSTWYRIGGVWVAPAGATFASMQVVQPLSGTAGEKLIFDAFMVEQSTYIGGFFDNLGQATKNTIVGKALSAVPQVVNGIRLGADIVLNDLILNTIDEDNTVWICTDLDGWWGQTEPELPNIARGTEDGSYDVQARLGPRSITISGFFIPTNAEDALSKGIDRLVSAVNLVRKGGWLVAHEAPTKAAWVRLSSRPSIKTINARGKTEFSIQLRAGDPNKYHWNDADSEGYTIARFGALNSSEIVENIGTADVSGVFTLTGPAGVGTTIHNTSTDQTMTLQRPLRGKGVVAETEQVEATAGVATIYTTAPHNLRVGDKVSLLNMVIPFSESDTARIVTHVSDLFPYTFSFAMPTDDIDLMFSTGQVYLLDNDVLRIDTYTRSVTYNGEEVGHRNRLTTLTDWVSFAAGDNIIRFHDEVTQVEVVKKDVTSNRVTLTTKDVHYLIPGEKIQVDLPVDVPLSKKKLAGNVVTLTTLEPHGFSLGDSVNVQSTETATVVTKSRTTNVATLTTQSPHGVAVSDQITVALPATASPSQKSLTSNVARITTQNAHGFSTGDSVTVALPATIGVANKQLQNNQATLTTTAPHNYTVGDSITVTMPSGAAITSKSRSGSQVVLTTATTHGYSIGDRIIVSFPTTTLLTGTRSISPTTNLVTVQTSSAHNFSVGDKLTISIGVAPVRTITYRASTATSCTLTLDTTHNWSVGERITVTGVSDRYNGTHYITSVTATTITYAHSGTSEATTSSTGSANNITISQYYNGTNKVIESVPSSTSFTYRAWDQTVATSSTVFSSPTVTNTTNTSYNGSKILVAASGTQFAYNF